MHGQLIMFPQPNVPYHSPFLPFSPPTPRHGSLHDLVNPPRTLSQPRKPPPPKKDRHRKIDTANGPRDRRMRLSLDVARKFFDLQDLLAFDKASKTVQWLLNKSKAAIKAHVAASKGKAADPERAPAVFEDKAPKACRKRKPANASAKPRVARECRDRARARARERTLEKKKKMMMMMEESRSHELKLSLEMLEEMGSDGDASIANFYYNDQGVENLIEDPWEINLMENVVDRVLLDEISLEMSYVGSPIMLP